MKFGLTVIAVSIILASAITKSPQAGLRYKDVKPIFSAKCVPCHGNEGPGGGFKMTTYEGIMKGGSSGKVVIPKNSAGSKLMKMVKGTVQPRMPLDSHPLSQRELEKISKWITQGAKK